MKTQDIFIALLVPAVLGFGFVIAKPAMQYFPPYLLMGMRFTIPALILVWWFPLPKGLYFDLFVDYLYLDSAWIMLGQCADFAWRHRLHPGGT